MFHFSSFKLVSTNHVAGGGYLYQHGLISKITRSPSYCCFHRLPTDGFKTCRRLATVEIYLLKSTSEIVTLPLKMTFSWEEYFSNKTGNTTQIDPSPHHFSFLRILSDFRAGHKKLCEKALLTFSTFFVLPKVVLFPPYSKRYLTVG